MDKITEFDNISPVSFSQTASSADIISMAKHAGLNPGLLYEAVIDLSADGLLTANCINFAAGILLKDLGLPTYFFTYIKKWELKQLLQSIALSVRVKGGKAYLVGQVEQIDFDSSEGQGGWKVSWKIASSATDETIISVLKKGQLPGR